jgi:prepilin-type N-terminal cleavage/methylation domain-containing protein
MKGMEKIKDLETVNRPMGVSCKEGIHMRLSWSNDQNPVDHLKQASPLKQLWKLQHTLSKPKASQPKASQPQTSQPQSAAPGFTLTELLVAMIIGGIVSLGLLTLVLQLAEANQTDNSRTETQRDMQQAMDYIAQDLREAVFVYDGACLEGTTAGAALTATTFNTACPGLINHLPNAGNNRMDAGGGVTPVLAFWRLDPLPENVLTATTNGCRTLAGNRPTAPNQDVFAAAPHCEAGKTYTLVVYGINESNTGTWRGRSRLVRYALSQPFNADGTQNTTAGYVNPTASGRAQFQQWPYYRPSSGTQAGTVIAPTVARPEGVRQVLVDFVDREKFASGTDLSTVCTSPAQITPRPATVTDAYKSFYACVRGNTQASRTAGTLSENVANQEVLLVLTGNVAGRPGFNINQTNAGRLAPLQTRVMVRGILNKNPL